MDTEQPLFLIGTPEGMKKYEMTIGLSYVMYGMKNITMPEIVNDFEGRFRGK